MQNSKSRFVPKWSLFSNTVTYYTYVGLHNRLFQVMQAWSNSLAVVNLARFPWHRCVLCRVISLVVSQQFCSWCIPHPTFTITRLSEEDRQNPVTCFTHFVTFVRYLQWMQGLHWCQAWLSLNCFFTLAGRIQMNANNNTFEDTES